MGSTRLIVPVHSLSVLYTTILHANPPTVNMKYAFVAIALAAAVHAQTIDDVPECAIPCLDDAIASETDCATDDYPCVCENFEAIQGVATSCVISECGAETALNEVLPAVEALCENAGSEPTEEPSTSAAPTNGTGPAPTGEPSPIPTGGAAALVPGLALA